jgi:hypothetical protein
MPTPPCSSRAPRFAFAAYFILAEWSPHHCIQSAPSVEDRGCHL